MAGTPITRRIVTRPPVRSRVVVVVLVVVSWVAAWLLALAEPAAAHTVGGVGPTNFRTSITNDPGVPGVELSVVENGSRLRLAATAGYPVLVEGYEGEPYLRLDADGVWENRRSSATYLNASRAGDDTGPPGLVDASAPPEWVRVAARGDDGAVAYWHDHRVHWMGSEDPPAVRAAPGERHRVYDWTVPMTADGRRVTYGGALDWVPGPSPLPWAAVTAGLLVAGAALGLARPRWPIAVALAGLIGADVTHSALVAAAHADGRLGAFFWGNAVQLVIWACGLAGAVLVARRSPTGLYLAMSVGLLLAVLGGLPDLGVFVRSGAPVAGPLDLTRALTAATVGLGLGLGPAGWLTLRRSARPAASPPAASAPAAAAPATAVAEAAASAASPPGAGTPPEVSVP